MQALRESYFFPGELKTRKFPLRETETTAMKHQQGDICRIPASYTINFQRQYSKSIAGISRVLLLENANNQEP